jgi:hypothetical protein
VVPVYYDYLNDEEAGTTAIKADGSTKIVTVKTSEWFETHETIKDGGASPKEPKTADSAAPAVKRTRRTSEQIAADDAAGLKRPGRRPKNVPPSRTAPEPGDDIANAIDNPDRPEFITGIDDAEKYSNGQQAAPEHVLEPEMAGSAAE